MFIIIDNIRILCLLNDLQSVTLCVFEENKLYMILYTIFNFKPEVVVFRMARIYHVCAHES